VNDVDIAASVHRAISATPEEHAAAISTTQCPICGAAPGVECTYGSNASRYKPPEQFPGRAHTRRVRAYIASGVTP
jgi:hypothetical protein